MATNPVDSLPDADRVKRRLAACPFVVVSDVVAANDTLPVRPCPAARRRLG